MTKQTQDKMNAQIRAPAEGEKPLHLEGGINKMENEYRKAIKAIDEIKSEYRKEKDEIESEYRKEKDEIKFGLKATGILFATICSLNVAHNGVKACLGYRDALKLRELEQRIETRDVDGNNLPEKYLEINGRKYFIEVDGKPIQEYEVERPVY